MTSFFRLLTEFESHQMAIYVYHQDARKIVSGVLKQFGIPLRISYLSAAEVKRDTGRTGTPRYIFSVARGTGNQIIHSLEKMIGDFGYEHLWDAGIEVYFD